MTKIRQLRFSFGQVGKELYAGCDLNFYALGLKQSRNVYTRRAGCASSRPGMLFCNQVPSTNYTRLIPFIFSPDPDQAYALEFSPFLMRVIRGGELVTEAAKAITAASKADPCQLTVVAHGFTTGDLCIIPSKSVKGMRELNRRQYTVVVIDPDTIQLRTVGGVNVNSTTFGTYVSGGEIAKVYEIDTPYAEADLFRLYFVQSADVMTIVHPTYAPRELSREDHDDWTLSLIDFNPTSPRPGLDADGHDWNPGAGGVFAGAGAGTAETYYYAATAILDGTGEESLQGIGSVKSVINITNANPAVVETVTPHNYVTGQKVFLALTGTMPEVNERFFSIEVIDGTHFSLVGEDSTAYGVFSATGYSYNTLIFLQSDVPTAATPNEIIVNTIATPKASGVKVYRQVSGVSGFLGYATKVLSITSPAAADVWKFLDIGDDPDLKDGPPVERNPFDVAGNWPAVVAMYQQRRVFAARNATPEGFDASVIGAYNNFTISTPGEDSDSVKANLAGNQVNEIRHMLDLQRLVFLTSGSEMVANGDSAGTMTPTTVNLRTYSYNGASYIKPVVVDNVVVFVQYSGAMLFGMTFDEFGRHQIIDLSLTTDLLEGHTIVDMAYQKAPHSIIWMVRDDGVLLSLTYRPDQGVQAWAIHDTDGEVESVCCIPGEGFDEVYLVVRRDPGFHHVERLADPRFAGVIDYVGADSAVVWDGRNSAVGDRICRLQDGVTWAAGESMTARLTGAGAASFEASDVGGEVIIRGNEADNGVDIVIRCEITAYVSANFVTVRPNKAVPIGLQTEYTQYWELASETVYELWPLEGQTIAVLRDGGVYASPNNSEVGTEVVVENGKIVLSNPGSVVMAGLPFLPDVETLNIDTTQGAPLIGKKKLLKFVDIFVLDTLGVFAGPKPPTDDEEDPLEGMDEYIPDNADDVADDIHAPISDVIRIRFDARYNSNGRVFIRQVDPLPMTILAIAPAGNVGLGG